MKRTLQTTLLLIVSALVALSLAVTWLTRSEQGSRWLVEQGLQLAPIAIKTTEISGTLVDGLKVASLHVALPTADVRATGLLLSWTPANLFGGVINIESAHIEDLSIAILQRESPADPPTDALFWLKIPLYITIESGTVGQLSIDTAEFSNLSVAGAIGHGRLELTRLAGEIAGASLLVSGELSGPAPGRLQAKASWELPAANLSGNGTAEGDIESLAVSHVLRLPDEIWLRGSIKDLLSAPSLTAIAEWSNVRLPGTTNIFSKTGAMAVSSDFRTARLEGTNIIALENWPNAPLSLEAIADLQGITIDAYALEILDGQITGSGRFEYRDAVRGQLEIEGAGLNTGLIDERLPGRMQLNSSLLIESTETYTFSVKNATAQLAGNAYSATGAASWRADHWQTVKADIVAGPNTLSADLNLGKKLTGTANANLSDLSSLWPGLQGTAKADLALGGTSSKPTIRINATAASLEYASYALATLTVAGNLQANNKLSGNLAATGLTIQEQQLGDLDFSLLGTLAAHKAKLKLTGDIVDIELRTTGSWDGKELLASFDYGVVQPEGFNSWKLSQKPVLRAAANDGQLEAHCWLQNTASICLEPTSWTAGRLASSVAIREFSLATLQPLLADGYGIDGTVDVDLNFARENERLLGELHWQQANTQLRYADNIDAFSTELQQVKVDLVATDERLDFAASASGDDGLTLTAKAAVEGPPGADSPLTANLNFRLPSIGLLRPLLQRVVDPGKLEGLLTIDLDVSGTLGEPVFGGGGNLSAGELGLPDAGITLIDINIAASSNSSNQLELSGQLKSGDGTAAISGSLSSDSNARGTPELLALVNIKGTQLASLRTPDLSIDMSPDLQLRITEDVFAVSGKIVIPQARINVRDLPRGAVTRSRDVIVHQTERLDAQKDEAIVTGDVEVVLGDDVRFNGFGLDSRLEGSLRLKQKRGAYLRSSGTVRVQDGFLTGYGKELRVDRGELTFTGPLDDPLINIQVSRESIYEDRQYTVGLRLSGSAQNIRTTPFSRPAMTDNDVLSFLLIDQPTGSGGDASGAALALGLGQLLPGDGGALGLDEVGFETNDANQATMVAGKRINDDIYVRYVFGSLGEPGAFRVRYRLGKGFSLEASNGARQSLDLIYLIER